MKKAIIIKNLSKSFRIHKKVPGILGNLKSFFVRKYVVVDAVKDLSFEIEQGELVGFIGPNGAGKTTTLKMLSGLLYPNNGKVEVLGFTPFERNHTYLKQIGLVMGQKNQLFWDLPAIDTFLLNKEIYEVSDKQYKDVLGNLVDMLDVGDILNHEVRKLSLGQRMKCELIASLIHSPKVLFLDEPTIGLDVVVQKNLRRFIKEYNKKYNSTIILTSHYMGDVSELCSRVIVINKGSLGYDGSLKSLARKYATTKTISFDFVTEVSEKEIEKYGKILSFNPLRAKIEVPREKASEISSAALKNLPVEDLEVMETPIEEIIGQVFLS